nr:MAG TPA: hypothetical protein [Bacteriophage sp.]
MVSFHPIIPSSFYKSSIFIIFPFDVNTFVPAHTHIPSVPAPSLLSPWPNKLVPLIASPPIAPHGVPVASIALATVSVPLSIACVYYPKSPEYSFFSPANPVNNEEATSIPFEINPALFINLSLNVKLGVLANSVPSVRACLALYEFPMVDPTNCPKEPKDSNNY